MWNWYFRYDFKWAHWFENPKPFGVKKIPWVEADIEVVNLLMGGIVCKILTII